MSLIPDDARSSLGLLTRLQEKEEAIVQKAEQEKARLAFAEAVPPAVDPEAWGIDKTQRQFNRFMVAHKGWCLCPSCGDDSRPTICSCCLCTGIELSSISLPEPSADEAKEIGNLNEELRPLVRRIAACLIYANEAKKYPWCGLHYRRPLGERLPPLVEFLSEDSEDLLWKIHYLKSLWVPVLAREAKRLSIPDSYLGEWASDCLLMGVQAKDALPRALKEVRDGFRTNAEVRTNVGKYESAVLERALKEKPNASTAEDLGRKALGQDQPVTPGN
jgi:hypothetical protein